MRRAFASRGMSENIASFGIVLDISAPMCR
jgi:hypothetical protein